MRTGLSESLCGRVTVKGSAFPAGSHTFIVHSVYASALNLLLLPDNKLFTLVADTGFLHPHAACVEAPEGRPIRFDRLDLEVGALVQLERETIRLGESCLFSLKGVETLSVVEETAPRHTWLDREAIERHGSFLSRFQREKKCGLFWDQFAAAAAFLSPGSSLFVLRTVSAAGRLRESFLKRDESGAVEAALQLVGLGEGLTPAGDDFLCGFTLSAWSWSQLPVADWMQKVLAESGPPSARTTDVSLLFLELAGRGLFSRALIRLASACLQEKADDSAWERAVAALGRMGHSSGLDAASGFLFGMSVGTAQQEFSNNFSQVLN